MRNPIKSTLHLLHSALTTETLATFGRARLVRHLNGKIELLGGSPADRRAAREWCSLFLHDAVFACTAQAISKPRMVPLAVANLSVSSPMR